MTLTRLFSMSGRMSSSALVPMLECKLSKVFAAASLTSGKGSHNAFLTVGMRLSAKTTTWSLLVELMISDRPMHTPCQWKKVKIFLLLLLFSYVFTFKVSTCFCSKNECQCTKNTNVLFVTCRWSLRSDSSPFSRIGIISGRTFSPNLRTTSPNVLAATWKLLQMLLIREQRHWSEKANLAGVP